MRVRFVALGLTAAILGSCASTVVPLDGSGPNDGARSDGFRGEAGFAICGSSVIHDGDRCTHTHDSCLTNTSCGGYTACDCGVDALWHCQTVTCTGDAGR